MTNTLSQGYAFLLYLYAGVVLGAVYGVLGIVIRLIDRRAVTNTLDALFVLVFAAVAYAAMQLADNGVVRFYALCTMAAGGALMHLVFFSRICKRIVKRRG